MRALQPIGERMSTGSRGHESSEGAHGRVRIVVMGAGGRMGSRICALAHGDERFEIVAALERAGSAALGRPCATEPARGPAPAVRPPPENPVFSGIDALIDFSSAAGAGASMSV